MGRGGVVGCVCVCVGCVCGSLVCHYCALARPLKQTNQAAHLARHPARLLPCCPAWPCPPARRISPRTCPPAPGWASQWSTRCGRPTAPSKTPPRMPQPRPGGGTPPTAPPLGSSTCTWQTARWVVVGAGRCPPAARCWFGLLPSLWLLPRGAAACSHLALPRLQSASSLSTAHACALLRPADAASAGGAGGRAAGG